MICKSSSGFLLQAFFPTAFSTSVDVNPMSQLLSSSWSPVLLLHPTSIRNSLDSPSQIYPERILLYFSSLLFPSLPFPSFSFLSIHVLTNKAQKSSGLGKARWASVQSSGPEYHFLKRGGGCPLKPVREEHQNLRKMRRMCMCFHSGTTQQDDEGVFNEVGRGSDILEGDTGPSRMRRAARLGGMVVKMGN